jgi:hypothetical protein
VYKLINCAGKIVSKNREIARYGGNMRKRFHMVKVYAGKKG